MCVFSVCLKLFKTLTVPPPYACMYLHGLHVHACIHYARAYIIYVCVGMGSHCEQSHTCTYLHTYVHTYIRTCTCICVYIHTVLQVALLYHFIVYMFTHTHTHTQAPKHITPHRDQAMGNARSDQTQTHRTTASNPRDASTPLQRPAQLPGWSEPQGRFLPARRRA